MFKVCFSKPLKGHGGGKNMRGLFQNATCLRSLPRIFAFAPKELKCFASKRKVSQRNTKH